MKKIGLIGGGPAALFMYKQLVACKQDDVEVFIFEKNDTLGAGMPYSKIGAAAEHITNVSDNELPEIVTPIKDWIDKAPPELLKTFHLSSENFNEYKVLPRLLFGSYLSAQFEMLINEARKKKVGTTVKLNCVVTDIRQDENIITVVSDVGEEFKLDAVVICTGHSWPKSTEKETNGWYDSPYPPQKLAQQITYPVAIRGAGLTAIDAVRTLARSNGSFTKNEDSTLTYHIKKESKGFKIILHSLDGLLPAIRFHLLDTQLLPLHMLSEAEVLTLKEKNDGFVPLDFVYKENFLKGLKLHSPQNYEAVKNKTIEEFVDHVMKERKKQDPFFLFKKEYYEAEKSIENEESVYWKEALASLSYAINYPAKHFSAEDMLRLRSTLMPLISIVIAFVPQSSCRELMALHVAGVLEMKAVTTESTVTPRKDGGAEYEYASKEITHYKLYIDAIGQKPMLYNNFPFPSVLEQNLVSAAYLNFREDAAGKKEMETGNKAVSRTDLGHYRLQVPGLQINDAFQVLDHFGKYNKRIYLMAVPFIAGLNPDYSGLDFCEAASQKIIDAMFVTP